jgi:parallel beta helix pectate lyase-like protein
LRRCQTARQNATIELFVPCNRSYRDNEEERIHDCQLNGMAAMEPGTTFRATNNVVTGLGAAAGIPHPGIALGRDARGSIEDNVVNNYVFAPCASITECEGNSSGIIVFFTTRDVKIARHVVGKTQLGIFVILASNVSVLENSVFDTDVFDGIAVFGDNNTIKGNVITNSDESTVFMEGTNNTVRHNTINETPVGLLVTAGNNLSHNQFFNTPVIQDVFDPGAAAESSRAARRQNAIASSVLRRLSR